MEVLRHLRTEGLSVRHRTLCALGALFAATLVTAGCAGTQRSAAVYRPAVTGPQWPVKTREHDLEALAANGWQLVDPVQVAGTPAGYRQFNQGSKGEFGIAKSGYVASRCGWFSDRSLCYLASGRPVLAQETGFIRFLPTGEGLFAFETVADVLAALEELNRDYPRHALAARALAEEFFDSDKVLARLLDRIGGAP